ncbi:MAG: competence/damage-inducible protein A [Deltaproteobacteria bacterium]|nr:competence/damage-inducible protein A [Deltaproteobacteria bacterium]
MLAEIVTIGDELCRGEVVDTNSSFMASELWDMGITCTWMTSCRDDRADMIQAFRTALRRASAVLVSGGLGPTEDDLTVDVLAEAAGVGVTTDPGALERLKARFAKAGYALTPNNLRQVRVPEGAVVFPNPKGLAPGFELRLGDAVVLAMPGVPRELTAIWAQSVAPRLAELAAGGEKIAKRTFRVFGLAEAHIDHKLAGLSSLADHATVHYQVAFPETLVKLVVRDRDAEAAAQKLAMLERELRMRLGQAVYGEGGDSLPSVLGRALHERGESVVVAESCTGGMLGSILTEVPGSSRYFHGGWITYTNEAKLRELGVREDTLRHHGAVSEQCTSEMARGARERAGSTYAVAISGIAGPGGGTPEKPVGTVHVAMAGPGSLRHKHYVFPGERDQVRRLACYWAMAMILREVTQ